MILDQKLDHIQELNDSNTKEESNIASNFGKERYLVIGMLGLDNLKKALQTFRYNVWNSFEHLHNRVPRQDEDPILVTSTLLLLHYPVGEKLKLAWL